VSKTEATLGGVALAGNAAVVWQIQTGTAPYKTVMQAHKRQWQTLKGQMGKFLDLKIRDGRGIESTFKNVTILHEVPSDSPNRVSFVVADRRWKWPYKLVCRDYNTAKRTGDKLAAPGQSGGVEILVTHDKYAYRAYSLDGDVRWTCKAAVRDVLDILEGKDPDGEGLAPAGGGPVFGPQQGSYTIESFPIEGDDEDGQFTLQNVQLRDPGDVALSRLLSYIPGAEVCVGMDGIVRVFNGADLHAAQEYLSKLPPHTWDGDSFAMVNRTHIRPKEVHVYYEREVELLMSYEDDYRGGTSAARNPNAPYLENVLPTVDPRTTISVYDPVENATRDIEVLAGTWVPVQTWLDAMDRLRPEGSRRWNFETISIHWMEGVLDGVLGGRGADFDPVGSVSMRIQALKQHFRQTFRLNRKYIDRFRDWRSVRVGLLDPISGARAPAPVWGQACIVPSDKGKMMASRVDLEKSARYRNVSYRAQVGQSTLDCPPGPVQLVVLDDDIGIFRLEWLNSPYGTTAEYVPCFLTNHAGVPAVPTRNLRYQMVQPIGPGIQVESGTNGIFLSPTMKFECLVTFTPSAPNTLRALHREKVDVLDIENLYSKEFGLAGGRAEPMRIYVSPGEATARFALVDEQQQNGTLAKLLGMDGAGAEGIEPGKKLDGYELINANVELRAHAKATAAEMIAGFADSVQGRVTTVAPREGLKLVGNMTSATVAVGAAPSAKVMVLHEFPGQQKHIDRLALLPDAARQVVLGTLPYK